jgi:predicted DNA-binding transcriptional regulator AlpA
MSFVPSIRECLERAELARSITSEVLSGVTRLHAELARAAGEFVELTDAQGQLRKLDRLVADMAACLRNHGQPRAATPVSAYPVMAPAPKVQQPIARRTAAPGRPAATAAHLVRPASGSKQPAGTLTTEQFMRRIDVSEPTFYKRRKTGDADFPKPIGKHGAASIYSEADVNAYKARHQAASTTPQPTPQQMRKQA